ncbi:hypothetical protein BB560_003576 [Smittium megazygosporum]|uniref:Mitochondrial nucleoid factor 1 n=1 Tax=Smittium megazygosporum TaxID=133381 RepID=A0A2T9ZBM5_9FUNG|nr:hypothetical protein BB560_003576 [Smittium megazygosporum]
MSKNLSDLKQIYNGYKQVISRWPKDKLRPNYCITQSLKLYAEENFSDPTSLDSHELRRRIDLGKSQLENLNYILDNKAKLKYPVSKKLEHPDSDPQYYTKLLEHLKLAAEGKTSSRGGFLSFFGAK